jgi:hypothetical protein
MGRLRRCKPCSRPETMPDWPLTQIDVLAEKVGLIRRPQLATIDIPVFPPVDACLWEATYAQLLFWPVTQATTVSLQEAATQGQDWLDHALASSEGREGTVIDGYLVLGFPQEPSEEILAAIRTIESSTQVCRKFVIWPVGDSAWDSIFNIPVLGLPDVRALSRTSLEAPNLSRDGAELVNRIEVHGYRPVAEADLKEADGI